MTETRRQSSPSRNTQTDETRLVKVQPHDDVGLFCQLVHRLQEVHMADV